jgi:hypothetical protein
MDFLKALGLEQALSDTILRQATKHIPWLDSANTATVPMKTVNDEVLKGTMLQATSDFVIKGVTMKPGHARDAAQLQAQEATLSIKLLAHMAPPSSWTPEVIQSMCILRPRFATLEALTPHEIQYLQDAAVQSIDPYGDTEAEITSFMQVVEAADFAEGLQAAKMVAVRAELLNCMWRTVVEKVMKNFQNLLGGESPALQAILALRSRLMVSINEVRIEVALPLEDQPFTFRAKKSGVRVHNSDVGS